MSKIEYHHTGVVVRSIDEAINSYEKLFGKESISQIYFISSQMVNVCFVKTGPGAYLELVEAAGENSVVGNLIKKGVTYYHNAYLVEDIDVVVKELININYKAMKYFNSEAFNGKRCVFLFTPDAQLIELIEK